MQRLPSPPLVPSSMSSGGETHSSALAQTAPGSQPVTPMPDPSLSLIDLDVNQGLPVPSGPEVPVSDQAPRDGLGRFTEDTGAWSQPGYMPEGGKDATGIWSQT